MEQETQPVLNNLPKKNLLEEIKKSFKQLFQKRKWLLAFFIMIPFFFAFLVVLFWAIKYLILSTKPTPTSLPIAASTPTPSPSSLIITNPSVYATDPIVLSLERQVLDLDESLAKVDLRESGLNAPTLNFDINFNNF